MFILSVLTSFQTTVLFFFFGPFLCLWSGLFFVLSWMTNQIKVKTETPESLHIHRLCSDAPSITIIDRPHHQSKLSKERLKMNINTQWRRTGLKCPCVHRSKTWWGGKHCVRPTMTWDKYPDNTRIYHSGINKVTTRQRYWQNVSKQSLLRSALLRNMAEGKQTARLTSFSSVVSWDCWYFSLSWRDFLSIFSLSVFSLRSAPFGFQKN